MCVYKLIIVSLFCLATSSTSCQPDTYFQKEVDKLIKYDTEIEWFPNEGALIVAITEGNWMIALEGSFEDYDWEELWNYSLFQIGGLSKTMTAYALRQAVVSGSIILNDTAELCLNHTSGLPKIPNNWEEKNDIKNPYKAYGKEEWYDFIRDFQFKKSPHLYSHLNYVWLDQFYNRETGISIDEWWTNWKKSQGIDFSGDTIPGLDRIGREQNIWDSKVYQGALGLLATPHQLQYWLKTQLSSEIARLNHIKKTQTSYHEQIFVGDAWHILDYEKYPIYMHSGRAGGHHAFMGFVKETQTGVFILSNCMRGTEDLGTLVLRMINNNWRRKSNGKEKE